MTPVLLGIGAPVVTISQSVSAGGDDWFSWTPHSDGYFNSVTGTPGTQSANVYYAGGNDYRTGLRFSLPIPKGATILAAELELYASVATTGTTELTFWAVAADNPAAPTTGTEWSALFATLTDASAPGTATDLTEGSRPVFPGLESVIQEIVSRPSWVNGNHLVLAITGAGPRINTYSFENGGITYSPILRVTYQ